MLHVDLLSYCFIGDYAFLLWLATEGFILALYALTLKLGKIRDASHVIPVTLEIGSRLENVRPIKLGSFPGRSL